MGWIYIIYEVNKMLLRNTSNIRIYHGKFNAPFFSSRARCRNNFDQYQIEDESGKLLKAKFSKISGFEKSKIPESNCLLTLSIGQPIHEGTHLASTLHLINDTFRSCTFVLGDTLQRHTMKIIDPSCGEETLLEKSEKRGDEWVQKNSHLLSMLRIPWNIRRWDYWLQHNQYGYLLDKIKKEYEKDQSYQSCFDKNIADYLFRLEKRGELNLTKDEAHRKCLDYLQEECAAMCLWINEGCEYELYANGRTPAMQATYEKFIETLHPNLLKPISLKFKKTEAHPNGHSINPTEEVIHGSVNYFLK